MILDQAIEKKFSESAPMPGTSFIPVKFRSGFLCPSWHNFCPKWKPIYEKQKGAVFMAPFLNLLITCCR